MSRPENYKNTDYEYDLRSKGVGGFGSPSSKPPTQNGNNEDQDLNQMIEQLQNQLRENKRRIREKEELMERELQQQRQHNNRFQEKLDKRETEIRQLSESQHRQLTEEEERSSRDNHSRVGPPSSNTLHVQRTMTQSADDTRTNLSTSRTLGNVKLQIFYGKSQTPMPWWTLFFTILFVVRETRW